MSALRGFATRAGFAVALVALLAALAPPAWAVGVPAGTTVGNSASVTAVVGGIPVAETSNVANTVVVELLAVDVTWQDAANVLVRPGDVDQVLEFVVTNVGNGVDTYTLSGLSTGLGGVFDPVFRRIVLDDGNGVYEPGIDVDYLPGTNDPTLDANDPAADSVRVFVLNDIPAGAADGDTGLSELRAVTRAGAAPPGTGIPGGGDGGVDAMIGPGGGEDADLGTYEVSTLVVDVAKSSTVADFFGGTQPVPGATITYQLVVRVTGATTAQGLVVRDPIPANATYVPNSLVLNGVPQTDADDAPVDQSFFEAGNNRVVFDLGDLPGGSPDQTITFQVKID